MALVGSSLGREQGFGVSRGSSRALSIRTIMLLMEVTGLDIWVIKTSTD